MSPKVLIGLLISTGILGIVVFGLGLPDRLVRLEEGDASSSEVSARLGYGADGYNLVMEQAARAVTQRDYKTAVELFLQVPAGGDPRAVRARMHAGQFLISELHEPTRGIAVLDELLAQFQEQIEARALLARTLDAVGRQFEADEHCREFIRVDHRGRTELFRLAENRVGVGNAEMLQSLHDHNPDDLNVRLGMALLDLSAGKLAEAEQALRQVVSKEPGLFTAQAGLASALIQQNKLDEYDAWQGALPDGAQKSSEIWLVRGQAAELRQQPEVAARCFVEAVRIDPDNLEANLGAAHSLAEIGRDAETERFAMRAADLSELREMVRTDPEMEAQQNLARAAEITENLGRLWETRGWLFNLATRYANDPLPQTGMERLQYVLIPDIVEKRRFEANPATHIDVSALPDK
jgi:tetratricopeptide (TPR) repeat protein